MLDRGIAPERFADESQRRGRSTEFVLSARHPLRLDPRRVLALAHNASVSL